jgi:isoaspartyl peptidase/L-asparaginase-like protein (Ntn-hydrolase superfamily)
MEKTRHVMLVGEGAKMFAEEGLEPCRSIWSVTRNGRRNAV